MKEYLYFFDELQLFPIHYLHSGDGILLCRSTIVVSTFRSPVTKLLINGNLFFLMEQGKILVLSLSLSILVMFHFLMRQIMLVCTLYESYKSIN